MFDKLPELTLTEQQMPLFKYYRPMKDLPEEVKKEIFAPPIPSSEAIPPERFLDWLQPLGKYTAHENAYCMFEDGSGYIATYMKISPDVNIRALFWYLDWLNFHPKSQPEGTGNLRYKIWNPADHIDHYYVNWHDKSDGIHTRESLDMGEGDRKYDTIRHSYNLREYGLTQERIDELAASGLNVSETSDWESFDVEGAHLTLGQIRPRPEGGFERRSCEWIGWRPAGGKLIREEKTFCNEAYLRKVAYHTLIEWHNLMTFVNDLYDEYHDKPIDAD